MNYTEFDANGRYVGKVTPVAAPVAVEVQEPETAEA
jgi:hypothetical protein